MDNDNPVLSGLAKQKVMSMLFVTALMDPDGIEDFSDLTLVIAAFTSADCRRALGRLGILTRMVEHQQTVLSREDWKK